MNLPENHFSGNEHYDFWELVYVIDGELNTTAGSSIYNLKKNSLILYEPSEFHTLSVDSGKNAEIFPVWRNSPENFYHKHTGRQSFLSPYQQYEISQRYISDYRSSVKNT